MRMSPDKDGKAEERAIAPQLSICIATFNRGHLIGQTLEAVIAQATSDVEIVVVDGGSTDQTQTVTEEIARAFPRLTYERRPINSGVDQDFDRAVELAAGKYCWLMSDDDRLLPEAIQRVLEAIADEPSLVVVNAEVRDAALAHLLEERRLRTSVDRRYEVGEDDELFREVADYMSFIGCVVVRRELWLGRERKGYFGSLFIHVGVIFQARLPSHSRVIAEPLVSIRFGTALWKPQSFEIWMFKWPNLIWSLPRLPDCARVRVTPRYPWRRLRTLVTYRARGSYSMREYERLIRPLRPRLLTRLMCLLIAILPEELASAASLAYYRVVHPDTKLLAAELASRRRSRRKLPFRAKRT